MASSHEQRCCPNHNHHHHHHCPHCPLRRHCHHCPLHFSHTSLPYFNFTSQTQTQTPQTQFQNLSPFNQPTTSTITSPHPPVSQELEYIELDGDEEDDEPVFVLTDEWREFFAKSEAKRKLEKKQAKKGKK